MTRGSPNAVLARWLASIAGALVVVACGGGGGETNTSAPVGTSTAPVADGGSTGTTPPPSGGSTDGTGGTGTGGGTTTPPPTTPTVPPLAAQVNIVFGDTVGTKYWPDSTNGTGNTDAGGLGDDVQGIACEPMVEAYHLHTHLSIVLDGKLLTLPALIGDVVSTPKKPGGCFYHLHTHDGSGKIHVEAAATPPTPFTLGQFFAIWGQPLSYTDVAGIADKPIVVYVTDKGVTTQYTGDLKDIQLVDRRQVVIQIGSALTQLPNYVWDQNIPAALALALENSICSSANPQIQRIATESNDPIVR